MDFDYSRDAPYHPERKAAFVTKESIPPFDAGKQGESFVNSWWLSNLSHLAYFDKGPLEPGLKRVGLELLHAFDHEGTQGFLTRSSDFAVLAFRGTEPDEFVDALTIAEFSWAPFNGDAKVHEGFLRGLDRVWKTAVEPALADLEKNGVPVWYTGHSLGAALATLAAARKRPAVLATFGSPRVGNEAFRGLLSGLPTFRFVNCSDIVTTVPPAAFGYAHLGTQMFLSESRPPVRNPSQAYVRRHTIVAGIRYAAALPWFRRGRVTLRAFADHSILNYTACLYRELQRSSASRTA